MHTIPSKLDFNSDQNQSQLHKPWASFNGSSTRPALHFIFEPFQLYFEDKWNQIKFFRFIQNNKHSLVKWNVRKSDLKIIKFLINKFNSFDYSINSCLDTHEKNYSTKFETFSQFANITVFKFFWDKYSFWILIVPSNHQVSGWIWISKTC